MSDSGRLDTGLFEELKVLTDASLRGEINAAQVARLEHLLRDPAALDLYLDLVWESHILATWAKPSNLDQLAESSVKSIPRSATRGFFGPLRRHWGDPRFALAMVCISTLLFVGLVAGVVAAVTVMFRGANLPGDQQIAEQGPPQPSAPAVPVARLIRVSGCVWSGEINSPLVGDNLVAGRKLVLKSGLAEFIFRNGAKTIVEGPAVCEFSSSASVGLSRGKCAVTVEDPSARGFVVNSPGMKYTDLGTEFGVQVSQSGEQEMHVFRGRVRADEAASESPAAGNGMQGTIGGGRRKSPLRAPRSLLLSAHQAIRLAAPGEPIVQMAADEKRFVRVILNPFPLFGTGVGLDRGAKDPHWEITKISTDLPLYRQNQLPKPRAAVVAVPADIYVPDNRDKGQWISDSKARGIMPDACRWTLRTHFDLSGFDPSSARIEGQISVDNYLVEIRLNGKTVRIPEGSRAAHLHEKWLPLKIEEAFVAGDNTLEIVIENGKTFGSVGSEMGLCIDWKGAAQPLLNLKSKD